MTAPTQPPAHPSGQARSRARLSIGKVLDQLRVDFPDVTISKLRFLESEGLVEPERAPSGYRKFSVSDVDRLRYVLSAQRDNYLPLKVIRANLDAIERGLEPSMIASQAPRVPAPVGQVEPSGGLEAKVVSTESAREVKLSRRELEANSGLSSEAVDALLAAGLLRPRAGTEYFDTTGLEIASAVARLSAYGLEARHLRGFKTAADREIGLIEQVTTPISRQRAADATARAAEATADLAALTARLHSALVASGLGIAR